MSTMANLTAEPTHFDEKDVKETLSEKAIKHLIAQGKQRGYITYEELNEILPEDKLNSEQIEDIMSMISDMGINIIEDEETEQEEKPKHIQFDEERADTLGGYLMLELGALPSRNTSFTREHLQFKILQVDTKRIQWLEVSMMPTEAV